MVAKIAETNFSHNWYLQGLLCKLYWRTIHGSWWKPIERYSWTKTVKEPEQSTRKIASIFCSWRWKSGTRERRATLLFGPSTLKTEIKSAVLSIFQPRCPPSRPRGRAREGRRTRRAPPSRGRGRCLRSSTFADHTPERRACSILSRAKKYVMFFFWPPLHQATCGNNLYSRLLEQGECRVGWTGHWSNPRLQEHVQVKTHLRERRIPAQLFRTREIRSSV